jgi:hypothetical protein
MAIAFERLQELLRAEGLAFFIDPVRARIMLGGVGLHGTYHVGIALESEGQFLQLRSLQLLRCTPDHPHYHAVMEVLARINCQYRFIKFALDPSDGEIVLFGDLWVADNTVTPAQFHTIIGNYLSALDVHSFRIRQTLETGEDPGTIRPEALLEGLGDALPPELRDLLDKLKKGGKSPGGEITEL